MNAATRRRWLIAAGATGAASVAALGWQASRRTSIWPQDDRKSAQLAADELMKSQFPTPSGLVLRMADLLGKPLLLNFWASWCAPCIRELPLLSRFEADHAANGWQVLALAADEPQAVARFLAHTPLHLRVALASGGSGLDWARRLGNHQGGLPYTVVLDRRGRVHARKRGELNVADLTRWQSALD